MGNKNRMRDPRFKVVHGGEELSLVTRSSDGQLLFLANMASKMNHKAALDSRIAQWNETGARATATKLRRDRHQAAPRRPPRCAATATRMRRFTD